MARIRSVHPGIASDEAFMQMSMTAKAAWPLLWTECDDHGVFEWKPVVLKARIFPADNVDFSAVLAEMVALDCVMRFEHEGKPYGVVRNFGRFQSPKNPSYRFPCPLEPHLYAANKDTPPVGLPQAYTIPTEKVSLMEKEREREKEEDSSSSFAQARVQERETPPSPPQEPSRHERLEGQLREAAGWQSETNPNLFVTGCIGDIIDAGADLQRDVLDTIRARAGRMQRPPSSGWAYFVPAILEAREKRLGIQARVAKPPPRADADPETWNARLGMARGSRQWSRQAWGPMPGETGCAVPASLLRSGDGEGWVDRPASAARAA